MLPRVLSEYDIRRPLTSTGTNLLGMVKHLTLSEARYFGDPYSGCAPLIVGVFSRAAKNLNSSSVQPVRLDNGQTPVATWVYPALQQIAIPIPLLPKPVRMAVEHVHGRGVTGIAGDDVKTLASLVAANPLTVPEPSLVTPTVTVPHGNQRPVEGVCGPDLQATVIQVRGEHETDLLGLVNYGCLLD
nr:DUF664 domain-containing protein [Amycolatopsis decaplanina]